MTNSTTRYRCAKDLAQQKNLALNVAVYPHWLKEGQCFWYVKETYQGKQYCLVDAKAASSGLAFNHRVLASTLSQESGEEVVDDNLPINQVEIILSPRQVVFTAFNRRWSYTEPPHQRTGYCQEISYHCPEWKLSPDGSRAAFVRDYNVWIKDLLSGEEFQLTTDGQRHYAYAGMPTVYGQSSKSSVEVLWSPNSRQLFTLVTDIRNVKAGSPLVKFVPQDGGLKPIIIEPDRRIGFLDDEYGEVNRFLAIDVDSGQAQWAHYHDCPVFYPPYLGYFSSHRAWWSNDSRYAYFIELSCAGKRARLVEFNTGNGETRVVIEETSLTRFVFIPESHLSTFLWPLLDSEELIWYSERTGWAHLYLYDLKTGNLKNVITEGDYLVRNILHYNAEKRELLIQTAGRLPGRNPYYSDICRVHIDSGELTPLWSTDDETFVCDQRSRASVFARPAHGVSPCGDFIVMTQSRVDQLPISWLLDRDGRRILELERAELSCAPDQWQWPEPLVLKADDGITDIYGVVFRPSDFDSSQRYPVIDSSFGDFTPIRAFDGLFYQSTAALANLGFIIVMINTRGTAMRSKAFADDKDSSLTLCYHQSDCVAWIRQLGERYSYIDLDRVGVGGRGDTAAAVSGLLRYPNFYKVGVSHNAFIDLRLMGKFLGEYTSAGLEAQHDDKTLLYKLADNLQGKLLLIHGLLDPASPVTSTLRLVEALQAVNKDFEMLLLPNQGHGYCDYSLRRTWDFFIQHLQRLEPLSD